MTTTELAPLPVGSGTDPAAVSVRGLTKRYGGRAVLAGGLLVALGTAIITRRHRRLEDDRVDPGELRVVLQAGDEQPRRHDLDP